MCKPLLDDDVWESHKFSIRLVESKRLGRTLPAAVNGLSAAQAQSQGLIEVASDAETASVANSESLFVGESDDESVSSRSRSGSPQDIRPVNAQAPELNPAATPFNPKPTTTPSARPNPFQAATTFGKPSGTPNQISSTPVFDFNSKSSNQTAHKFFESKEPSKFNLFPSDNGTKIKESKGPGSIFDSKEQPKASFFASHLAPKTGESSNGTIPSSSTLLMDKKTTFEQPLTTFPTTTIQEQRRAVTEELLTSTEAAVPSKPKSIFDQAKATPSPPIFSFGTSPLFGPTETGSKSHDTKSKLLQIPQEDNLSISALQQKDAAITFFNSGTPSSPEPKSFGLSAPSNAVTKETNLPQAASFKYPNNNHPLLPTSESQLNAGSSQPSILPSSTTPVIQPTLFPPTSKSVQTTSTANAILEPITSSSRAFSDSPIVKRSGSQSSQAQSTFTSSPLDPKAVALDQLSKCILVEHNGVIQHFLEFTVGPIIKASIAQFNDESSWKEASQSSPSGFLCGERMLIGNREVSCSLVS